MFSLRGVTSKRLVVAFSQQVVNTHLQLKNRFGTFLCYLGKAYIDLGLSRVVQALALVDE